MATPITVLVVCAEPDERTSTRSLAGVVAELERRTDVDVAVWYLRVPPTASAPWHPGARDVDALRTWWPAAALSAVGLEVPAGWLRGRRLRRWLRDLAPDAVILDDGYGDRLLGAMPGHPVVVARHNEEPPPREVPEPPPSVPVDLEWATPILTHAGTHRDLAVRSRAAHRLAVGAPEEDLLVVGWGGTGWLDGADLFVRALWHLEHREGTTAHGLWLRTDDDPAEVRRLQAEAVRCGLGDRFHVGVDALDGIRLCGDAVFLPYRIPATDLVLDLLPVVCAGLITVAFPAVDVVDPAVRIVDALDLDAAARELAGALRSDDAELAADAHRRLDIEVQTAALIARIRAALR